MHTAWRRRVFASLALSLALGLATPTASAIVVAPIEVEALTRTSDDVIVATVVRETARWEGGRIVTDHELSVAAVLKGRLVPRATAWVRTAGGTLGNITQRIADVPSPEVGQSYVFFLSGGVGNVRYLAHITAGLVPLQLDANTGRVVAVAPEGLRVTPASGTVTPTATLPFDALSTRVMGVVR